MEYPTLEAINSANKAELQSLARKGGYKVSGTKKELQERLSKAIHGRTIPRKSVRLFSKSSERAEYHKRPDGEPVPFGIENVDLVASLMGLGGMNNKNLLHELSHLKSQRNSGDFVACYVDPSLQINKSICRWCGNQARCNEKENSRLRKHINYEWAYEGVSYDGIDLDAEIINSFISQNGFFVKYPTGEANQPFSDGGDPFSPFFGRGYSRELQVVPSAALTFTSRKQNSIQWPHTFFSKYMNRTLTVFEAMVINLATSVNSLKVSTSAADEFPTLKQVSAFFLPLEITNQNLLTLGLNSSTEGGKLVYDMISTSKRWYEAGLYFGPVELFSKTDAKVPFLTALRNFLTEVKSALKRTVDTKINKVEGDNLFIQDRNDVIILSPKPTGSELQPLPQYRPVREIVIKELVNPWFIVDGEIQTRNEGLGLFHENIAISNADTDYSEIPKLLTEIIQHPMDFLFTLWNHAEEERLHKSERGKRPLVSVYLPGDLLAAYSSHSIFINQKLTQNNRYFYKQREDFEIFIERMYFSKLDNRRVIGELRQELGRLREVLSAPRSKRLTPFNRLLEMSKVAPRLIRYSDNDPDGTDDAKNQITEEICFEYKYTKAGEESNTKIVMRRVSKGERKLSFAKWKIIRQDGEMFPGQQRLLNNFKDAVNPNNQPGQKSSRVLGLYLSKTVLSYITKCNESQEGAELLRHLGSILNSYSNSGIVCLSSAEEYEIIKHNLGPARLRRHSSTGVDGKEIQFVSWNPPQIAGSSSKLAFFVGNGS